MAYAMSHHDLARVDLPDALGSESSVQFPSEHGAGVTTLVAALALLTRLPQRWTRPRTKSNWDPSPPSPLRARQPLDLVSQQYSETALLYPAPLRRPPLSVRHLVEPTPLSRSTSRDPLCRNTGMRARCLLSGGPVRAPEPRRLAP